MTTVPRIRLRTEFILARAADRGLGRIEDLAEAVGIRRPSLSALLNHQYLPSLPTLDRLGQVLDVPVDELYDGRAS